MIPMSRYYGIIGSFAALVFLAALFGMVQSDLIPQSITAREWDVLGLVWLVSAAAIALGFAFGVLDVTLLRKEWNGLRLKDPAYRARLFRSSVESGSAEAADSSGENATGEPGPSARPKAPTLLQAATKHGESLFVERIRQVGRYSNDPGAPRDLPERLRREALWRTDRYGVGSRFIASSLLLLAVIGTFAGMKEALPGLVTAIEQYLAAAGSGSELARSGIIDALAPVAAAFGANFLALVGALAMALIAFAIRSERRAFLIALERTSADHLYKLIPAGADATALGRAVSEMSRSVGAVSAIGDQIGGLQGDIRELQRSLVGAIEGLHTSFNDSIRRQSIDIQAQLTETVGRVATSLGEVTDALAITSVSYQGLVKGLEERDLGLTKATQALTDSGDRTLHALTGATSELASAVNQIGVVGTAIVGETRKTATAHEKRATELLESLDSVASSVATVAGEVSALASRDQMDDLASSVSNLSSRLDSARDAIASLDKDLDSRLEAKASAIVGAVDRVGERLAELSRETGLAAKKGEEERARLLHELGDEAERLQAMLGMMEHLARGEQIEALTARIRQDDAVHAEAIKGLITRLTTVMELLEKLAEAADGVSASQADADTRVMAALEAHGHEIQAKVQALGADLVGDDHTTTRQVLERVDRFLGNGNLGSFNELPATIKQIRTDISGLREALASASSDRGGGNAGRFLGRFRK
jgi:DNA-binding PadR family transcriptional regulator